MTRSDPRMVIAYLLAAFVLAICVLVVVTSPGAVRASHSAGEDSGRLPEVPHVPAGIQPVLGEVRESAVGWHRYPDRVPGGTSLAGGASASVVSAASVPALTEGWPSGKALVSKTSDGGQRRGGSTPSPSANGWVAERQGSGPLSRRSVQADAGSTPAPSAKTATWCAPTPRYCKGWDRAYVGARWSFRWGDKPYSVQVCGIGYGCTVVRVVSFCACRDRRGIDLSLPAWREIGAPFGLGRIDVTIRRVPTLPETDYGGKP